MRSAPGDVPTPASPRWPVYLPLAGLLGVGIGVAGFSAPPILALLSAALLGAVIAAVHHAEVIAHKIGEPFGTLVLALAVTVIEVALILSLMMGRGHAAAALPRDTVYAAVMIICNGVVGLCVLIGGLRHREQSFRIEGTGSGFAALAALSVLVLVMPTLTVSSSEGSYTTSQLVFVAFSSLLLWLVYVFIQTVRHRDYFLPAQEADNESAHAEPPSARAAWISLVLLLASLTGVVGMAKVLSPAIEGVVERMHAPPTMVGIIVAIIVLLPETWAAARAARANRLQTSMNLAIGSALASIGLTIPAVVATAVVLQLPLELGLEAKDIALLALSFIVGAITLGSGRTNVMQGAVHLVIFAAFLFLSLVP